MSFFARSVLAGLVLLTGTLSLFGASKAEERAFGAAAQAFHGTSWERAERELGAFVEQYPQAENRAEAVLLRAEARLKLKHFAGAIELLNAGRATAGGLGDEYLFWLAEAHLQSGQLVAAAELYAQFAVEFTSSPRLLEAVVAEATVRSQLKQWARVTEILQRPDGVFQLRAKEEASQPTVVRGGFLLAKTLFEQGRYAEAESALLPLATEKLDPRLAWQRDHLLASIQSADGRKELALATSTNLVTGLTTQPALLTEGLGFRGRIFEELGRADEAIAAWQGILDLPDAPTERQREALLRVGDLLFAQGRVDDSVQTLEKFLAVATNSPVADIAWLAVGELRLRQFTVTNAPAGTNATVVLATNLLPRAQVAFDTLLERFPKSPLVGKAQLGRGWCLWLAGRVAECEGAFEAAANALEPSYDQAVARFKLADARVQQTNFAGALGKYREVVASGDVLPPVRSNLVERALYQILQVARAAGDDAAANAAMAKLLDEFPEGSLAGPGLLAFGSVPGGVANPAARRGVLEDFLKREPDATLAPAVRLAVARTYEQERNWPKASAEYAAWLVVYPEHAARGRAEYFCALALARSGDETNALTLMTNFVAAFPTNEFAALAQWWVADHFWREEDFKSAERDFQLLFQSHPDSPLRFEAQLRAGQAAYSREKLAEAINYFTNLTSNPGCPQPVWAQAMFAYGDTLMWAAAAATNRAAANYSEAIKVFRALQEKIPDAEITLLAEGKIGQCYFQLGAVDPGQYKNARQAFDQVLASKAGVPARSEAEWGLGQLMEKQSSPTSSTNQNVVLQQALDRYLNVVYETNLRGDERSDPYWVKRAGLEACRVAESLQEWGKLSKLCDTLADLLPPLRPLFEKKKARAEEQLKKASD